MSERLQELERAIGAGAPAGGEDQSAHSGASGEGSARASEAGSAAASLGRAVSAGLVRLGSASIRRTLGSFRWGPCPVLRAAPTLLHQVALRSSNLRGAGACGCSTSVQGSCKGLLASLLQLESVCMGAMICVT